MSNSYRRTVFESEDKVPPELKTDSNNGNKRGKECPFCGNYYVTSYTRTKHIEREHKDKLHKWYADVEKGDIDE